MQHAREQRPLSSNELSTFCAQISMILQAGISLQEGVSILMEDAAGQEGQAVYHAILSHLELGAPLHAALKETGCFPHYLVHMTEIGERSGKLEQVMHSLGAYYKREQAVASSIRSAVSYPLIMIGMMLGAFITAVDRRFRHRAATPAPAPAPEPVPPNAAEASA